MVFWEKGSETWWEGLMSEDPDWRHQCECVVNTRSWEGLGQWHPRTTEYVCSLDPGCQTPFFTKGIWDPWRNEVFQILGRGNSVWGWIILYQKPRKWSKIDGDMSEKEQPEWVPNGQIWAFWAQKRMTIMDTVNLGSPQHSKWKSQGCSWGVRGASYGHLPVQVESGRSDIHQENSRFRQDHQWLSESIVCAIGWWGEGKSSHRLKCLERRLLHWGEKALYTGGVQPLRLEQTVKLRPA